MLVEFLGKFANRGIEIARVNSILITISINLLYFFRVLGFDAIEGDFPCIIHLQRSL